MKTENLIDSLAKEAKPQKKPLGIWFALAIWYVSSFLLIWICAKIFGFEFSFFDSVASTGMGKINLLGVLVSTLSALSALLLSYPGRKSFHQSVTWSTLIIWVIVILYAVTSGFEFFGMPEWWRHMKSLCFSGTVIFGLIPAGILFYLVRRNAPTDLFKAGMYSGLAGAAMGAFTIQCACSKEDPFHVLVAHFLPVIIVVLLGLLGAKKFLRW